MKSYREIVEIDEQVCVGCGLCAGTCPTGAICLIFGKARVNPLVCTGCGRCLDVCPKGAIRWRDEQIPRRIPPRPCARRNWHEWGRFFARPYVLRRPGGGDNDIDELRRRLKVLEKQAGEILKRIQRL